MLTTFGRPGYLRRAMGSGAQGFMLKDAPAHELAVAIRRTMAGERVVDPQLAALALRTNATAALLAAQLSVHPSHAERVIKFAAHEYHEVCEI